MSLWNDHKNDTPRQMAAAQAQFGTLYGSVGYAKDFPDKCLITFAVPEQDRSMQFVEGAKEGPGLVGNYSLPQTGALAPLPASVKAWNLEVTREAKVTLGGTAASNGSQSCAPVSGHPVEVEGNVSCDLAQDVAFACVSENIPPDGWRCRKEKDDQGLEVMIGESNTGPIVRALPATE